MIKLKFIKYDNDIFHFEFNNEIYEVKRKDQIWEWYYYIVFANGREIRSRELELNTIGRKCGGEVNVENFNNVLIPYLEDLFFTLNEEYGYYQKYGIETDYYEWVKKNTKNISGEWEIDFSCLKEINFFEYYNEMFSIFK